MASFSAELHVAGQRIPLVRCAYDVRQATDSRGRVVARARHSLVSGEADVPDHATLETWAADPQKRQAASLVFRNADTGTTLETLYLAAAYCTAYAEQFVSGERESGAYRCFFTLADPDGWVLHVGALPGLAQLQPPAREHGSPPLALGTAALGGGAGAAQPFVSGPDGVPRLPRIVGRPPFTVKGPRNGRPGLDRAEFARQLTGQEQGLNRLTVAEFLANRDRYLAQAVRTGDGRASEGNAAQTLARAIAFRRKVDELQANDEDLSPEEAAMQAQQWLDTQAALHDPDQVAGGHADQVTGMGSARINSSIGAQWPKRIIGIDQQIRQHAANMTLVEQASTYLNIELPLT